MKNMMNRFNGKHSLTFFRLILADRAAMRSMILQ